MKNNINMLHLHNLKVNIIQIIIAEVNKSKQIANNVFLFYSLQIGKWDFNRLIVAYNAS